MSFSKPRKCRPEDELSHLTIKELIAKLRQEVAKLSEKREKK